MCIFKRLFTIGLMALFVLAISPVQANTYDSSSSGQYYEDTSRSPTFGDAPTVPGSKTGAYGPVTAGVLAGAIAGGVSGGISKLAGGSTAVSTVLGVLFGAFGFIFGFFLPSP